jgi:Leu/Phe-tRNA-protein transferase
MELVTRPPPLRDRFYCYLQWDAAFIDQVCQAGLFPMATHLLLQEPATVKAPLMLVKVHSRRCCLHGVGLDDLHISRTQRRQLKKYTLSVNTAWSPVVARIQSQHQNCWLYPPLAAELQKLQLATIAAAASLPPQPAPYRTKVFSIELHYQGTLVAGEIGYAHGAVYTSMTGFYDPAHSGAGSMQLVALGLLLRQRGFVLWDFGMEMPYKIRLGAKSYPQDLFLQWRALAARQPVAELPSLLPLPVHELAGSPL